LKLRSGRAPTRFPYWHYVSIAPQPACSCRPRSDYTDKRNAASIELDNNAIERSIRPIALNRKNALFAGSDGGAEHWAAIASLIETCKLNDVDPVAYPTTSSPGSSTAIRTARSTNCSLGPIDVKTSKP